MLSGENLQFLKNSLTFWDKLTKQQADYIVSNTSLLQYRQKEHIHSGIHDCIGVVVVKKGRLRNYILSDEGKEVTLFRLNSGEVSVLTASCAVESVNFDIQVDAEHDSDIFIIKPEVFKKLCAENIYVENYFFKTLASHFSDVMAAMEQILFLSFEKRLALFLINQSELDGCEYIRMTHESIANHMGSAREVVSRMLKYFQKEGIVELSRGDIGIINREKLERIAE
ncbi:MAG: Crp/Fnr family transcriptional regulator [Eubacteriales bacterium]|jgi:CRP/FNR family transcriptional regulator|nr:Crp/Fnr family transcriptional regulator [Eubacteriales bacterium]